MKKLFAIFFVAILAFNGFSEDCKYFPKDVFSEIKSKFYSNVLDLLDPVNLQDADCNAVRFSCIESMTRSYVIRLSWTDGDGNLDVFVESLPNQGESKIDFQKNESVAKYKIDGFLSALDACNFYEKPSTEFSNGRDGADWIVETNINGSYKVVCRWSPRSGFLYELGNMLIDMTGERIRLAPEDTLFKTKDIQLKFDIRDTGDAKKLVLECTNVSGREISIPYFYLDLTPKGQLKNNWFSVIDENGNRLKFEGTEMKIAPARLQMRIKYLKPGQSIEMDVDIKSVIGKYNGKPSKRYTIFYSGPLGESNEIEVEN